MVEFPKISIKMKNLTLFYESQTSSLIKEIIQPPITNFQTEIYRNIQTFSFQELQKRSSWASRNSTVQILFLAPTRNMFLAVFRKYIFHNVEWFEVRKMSEVFWVKLYCKMSDLFLLVFVAFEIFYQKSEIRR